MNNRKPPHAPTVQHLSSSADHNFARRRVRYHTTEVDQAISVHSRCPQPRKPSTPWPKVDIDFDSEVQEAVRVNQELDSLHRRLAEEGRKTVLEAPRIPSVAAKICSIPGSFAPGFPIPAPPTGPRPEIRRPHGPWDGHNARRGTGFRSRAAQEEPPQPKKEEAVSIPDKIRKQMKKYFS